MPKMTRREFLVGSALAVSGPHSGRGRNPAASPQSAVLLPRELLPAVAVAQGTDADSPETILKTSLDGLGGLERFIKPGQTVAIKPNATWAYPPGTASSTDPRLLGALILMAMNAGAARIIVMDHCSLEPGADVCLRLNGIKSVVDDLRVETVFADRSLSDRDLFRRVDLPNGRAFRSLGVIKAAVEADVRINLAVAKSHVVTRLTMCLKHMMGFLEAPGRLHAGLDQGIADINTPSPVQAQLHILEAVRVRLPSGGRLTAAGPETEISHPHKIKRLNQIVAGRDPLLVDAYGCSAFFSADPNQITHLYRARESGVGEMDVEKARAGGRLRVFSTGSAVRTSPLF